MASYIIDIAAAAILVIAFAAGMKKGMVKSVWHAASWLITAVLVLALVVPMSDFLKSTPVYEKAYETVQGAVSQRITDIGSGEKLGIPDFILKNADIESAADKTAADISENITGTTMKIAVFVLLFIIIKLLLALVFHILNAASKLPVINSTNKLLGGLLGLINTLFVIYIICAVLALFVTNEAVSDTVNSTYLVKYFYNNNILLQLVFKR